MRPDSSPDSDDVEDADEHDFDVEDDADTPRHDADERTQDDVVDATTLDGLLMFGYQGWYACVGDGSPVNRWFHWFRDNSPTAENVSVDMWPDVSELDPSELCATELTLHGGGQAQVYSAWNMATVVRHMYWLKEHELDGVFLHRFCSELHDPPFREHRDQVARNVRAGAEQHGRVFAILYDITGIPEDSLVSTIIDDWIYLVDDLEITTSDRYLHHRGRPLVAIWGLGFEDHPGTPNQARTLIDWFRSYAPERLKATIMGVVPSHWSTLTEDSKPDPEWAAIYRSFDVISPWSVGRYRDEGEADEFRREHLETDLIAIGEAGADFMPVVFPGYSRYHLGGDEFNLIPRRGGRFFWRQVFNTIDIGANMIYVAMFDQVDNATAIFRIAPTAADTPTESIFLSLDADGESLPADWYLRLSGEAGKALRGEIPLSPTRPIDP